MKTIKQNSWHFKLHKKFTTKEFIALRCGEYRINKCRYYNKTLLLILATMSIALGLALGLALGGIFVYSILFSIITMILNAYFNLDPIYLPINDAFFGFGVMGIFSIIVILIAFIIDYIAKRCSNYIRFREPTKKEPGFFASMIKDYKEKFCPLIKLENESNNR